MGDLHQLPPAKNPRRVRRHLCCPFAHACLRGFPSGSSIAWALGGVYGESKRWSKIIAVLHCPWCGVELLEGDDV